MASNKLHINMGKCCFIEFKTKNKNNKEASPDDDTHQLILDDIPIKKVKATKFLGITIDEELNWNQHFTDLKRKLYHSLSTLNRIKHQVFPTICTKTYILPYLKVTLDMVFLSGVDLLNLN